MISASSSAWSRRLPASSWNNSARSRPAKPRHSESPALALSTAASTSSREETAISSMVSSVAGLITCIVVSAMVSFPLVCPASAPPARAGASRSSPTRALEVDCHVLRLEVLFDAFRAAFTAEAGVLDAAEGGGGVGDHALVEAYHACLETLADAQGPLKVAGVDVGHEAVFCVVGGGYGLLFRIEGGDRGHGAEDLLLEERRVVGNIVEDGGTVEVARTFHLLGPDYGAGPLAQGVFHEISDLIALVAVDEGADLDTLLGPAPDLHGVHALRELLGELVRDAAGDVEAVGSGARLPDVAHLGDYGALDRGVYVGVVEDEERGVTTQLHGDAQELLGRLGDELAADLRGARKRELAGARVGDERSHGAAGGGARHHVEDAAGEA